MADRRTEITIETDQVLIVRYRRTVKAWCVHCRSEVEVIDAAQADAIQAAHDPTRHESFPSRGWHVCEDGDRASMICLQSLLKSLLKNKHSTL